jgi:acetylglutamate kinase
MSIPATQKAEVLLEALPYIHKFRGSTFVVKYGGSFMDDPSPEGRDRVATDIAFLAAVGIQVVVVHGGGKAITRAMDKAGIKSEFRGGMRVTDAATVKIVEETDRDEFKVTAPVGSKNASPVPNKVAHLIEKTVAVPCRRLLLIDPGVLVPLVLLALWLLLRHG